MTVKSVISSKIRGDVRKALDSEKIKVFLGGSCPDGNQWRKDIKKKFRGDFFFIDPYDEGWDPSDNIYDELAGLVNADWIIFYDAGKQSDHEKEFLKSIGRGLDNVRNFSDLGDLERFLEAVKMVLKPFYLPNKLRKCAALLRGKTAKKGVQYSYACATVRLPDQLGREVISWGRMNVPDRELYTEDEAMGRENDIHATLFYGLIDNDPEKFKELIGGMKPFDVRLGLINAFKDADKHDVLKIDAESPVLERLHYLIDDKLDHKNKYPTYHAHVTIVYLKKGHVNKYIGDDTFRDRKFRVDTITFSTKDSEEYSIPLIH